MVSWFRSFEKRWKAIEDGPPAILDPAWVPRNFSLMDLSDRDFRREFQEWIDMEKRCPGVLIVAWEPAKGGKARHVEIMHHLLMLEGEDPDLVGIGSLEATSGAIGVVIEDLFRSLLAKSNWKKTTAKDWYVPSFEALMDDSYPIEGKFVPLVGDTSSVPLSTVEDMSKAVFVPFPLMKLMFARPKEGAGDESGDEDSIYPSDDYEIPKNLLTRLIEGLKEKQEQDEAFFTCWYQASWSIIKFLWMITNGFATGATMRVATSDRRVIYHMIKCNQELLLTQNDPEVIEVEEEKLDSEDEDPEPGETLGTEDIPEFDGGNRNKDVPSKGIRTAGQVRAHLQFEDRRARNVHAGEEKNEDNGQGFGGGTNPDLSLPTNLPTWVAQISTQMLASFAASAQAIANAGQSLNDMAVANKSALDKKDEKKQATSKWLPSAVFLLKVLSAEDGWDTQGVPEVTEFAEKLFGMKIFGATQQIRSKAQEEKWKGGMLKAGVSEFIKRGFVSEDVLVGPSGFSVLFFFPSGYTETDSEDFGMQQIRETFGDGDLPEDMIKAFSKLHIFVPENTYQAAEQLQVAISFLESVCGEMTIATAGYKRGLSYLTSNRMLFKSQDTLFLLNYLYMLDRVFQQFCLELKRYENEPDPILAAREQQAKGWMERQIERPMSDWIVLGTVPSFGPPNVWRGKSLEEGVVDISNLRKSTSKETGKGGAKKKSPGASGGSPSAGRSQEKPWHRELPADEYVREWRLPTGRQFTDFFTREKPSNFVGLPLVTHHKLSEKKPICLRHQIQNSQRCRRGYGCPMTHIKPSDLSREDKDAITIHLKRVYSEEQA